MRNSINDQIQAKVEAFTAELTELVRQSAIESVQEALGGYTPAPARRGRKATASTTRRKAPVKRRSPGKRVRRSEEEIAALQELVLTHVKTNDGHRLEEISRALGIESAELKRPVANLLEAKAMKTTGQKRGTKYHATGRAAGSRTRKKKPARHRKAA